MAEGEEIQYTPEELEEIERIVGMVERGGRAIATTRGQAAVSPAPHEEPAAEEEEYHAPPDTFKAEPDELTLPSVDFDDLSAEKPAMPPAQEEQPIEDITGLIKEVEEEQPEARAEAPPADLSAIDELERLTAEEPTSLDAAQVAPEEAYRGGEEPAFREPPPERGAPSAGIDELEAFDMEQVEQKTPAAAVGIEEAEEHIPDLTDISFEEKPVIPDASEVRMPDIVSAPPPPIEESAVPEVDELTDEDLASLHEVGVPVEGITPSKDIIREVRLKEDKKPTAPSRAEKRSAPIDEEPFRVEMLDEEPFVAAPASAPSGKKKGEEIELSERDLNRLKKAIVLLNASLRQTIKDVVVNDLLPISETRQLINMILGGRREEEIHRFLETKLKRKIPLAAERPMAARRVITARPEYTAEGRERQKRLMTATSIAGGVALITAVLVVIGYQFIYKPYAAKRLINKGAALIRESGDYLKKPKDYAKAEEIFRDVDQNYIRDYVYGYTEYARAYLDKKEYEYSLDKLNRLYKIQLEKNRVFDADLLNALGFFYAKVPKEFYNTIRLNINTWYYPGSGKKREEWSSLDVAIEFYRRVLARDASNLTALFGIGNAYFYQGEYYKAKKYYEDIIALKPKSWEGYAGLMNLYIERDVFEQAASMHAKLLEADMLDDLPSPLLAKLAAYYLDKAKTPESNIRIDYGVQSGKFVDEADNVYPAAQSVLEALNRRDKDYPPLHLQYARMRKAQRNLKLMRIHLEKAIDLSLKNYGADYFGALHLLGEYYYLTREPVKAYEYLNRAVRAAENPPEFTREDFYRETESPGKSMALLGNLFYYYFDKVVMRYGDLEDETVESDEDKLANYQIAREKYEKALEMGYESPELHYNLGRVYYLNRLYQKALEQWLSLYEDFVEHPELMFALGNAFYHIGNYEAAKGEYLKLISVYENDLDRLKIVRRDLVGHVKMATFTSSAYNNLGAVYQMQNNELKSNVSYWKAITSAQRIDRDNEFARVNLARAFKGTAASEPILDESIPYSIDYYREDLRD